MHAIGSSECVNKGMISDTALISLTNKMVVGFKADQNNKWRKKKLMFWRRVRAEQWRKTSKHRQQHK